MTHLSMEALLSLREAGLEPGDTAAREHLESCPGCRAELERLHQRVARLKALPALRPTRAAGPGRGPRPPSAGEPGSAADGLAAAASIALG
jgi:hypothetical protein